LTRRRRAGKVVNAPNVLCLVAPKCAKIDRFLMAVVRDYS
jgi:hypothetical protein